MWTTAEVHYVTDMARVPYKDAAIAVWTIMCNSTSYHQDTDKSTTAWFCCNS